MSENIGSILGYLRLDRSDWDNEIRAAMAKADELGRKSPNIKIGTNAPSAIAQLAAVAAAVKRLQDAQGAENVAQAKLTELQDKGNVSAGRLAAAQERLDKAHRSTAAAAIALAAAEDAGDRAAAKAAMDTAKLGAAADKTTASFKIGLIPALAMLAPAAIPIAGVAGGALLGLLPVAATVELGIKGIENQMKKGAVQGTAFAASVNALKAELGTLEQNAAGGLMNGINTALSKSGPLFETVNRDVSVMSGELGQIVGSAAPSLVKILTDLDPLFQTFGQGLVRGAADLERWANSSDGISRFVAYVQSELPTVEHTLANVITLIAHLAEGAAPFGGVLLNDINLFVGALDKIPVPLLQTAVPVIAALYAAVKTNQAVTVGVTALNNALGLTGPKAVAAAQAQNAASLQVQAAATAEAAGVARAKATEAAAAAEAAAQIAASTGATSSVLAAGAAASAEAAAEFAAAMQAEASAAEANAAQVAASSEAASAAVAASGEAAAAASVGFGSMLGPLGAVVIGGGLLASVFMHSGQSAQQAAQQVNTYTQALEASRGAINDDVRSKVALALANTDAGKQAAMFGVSHEQLINTIISGGPALTSLKAKLDDAGSALGSWTGQAKSGAYYTRDQSEAGIGLSKTLSRQSSAFGKAVAQAKEYRSYMGEATQATQSQSQSLAELNTKLGITVSNLLSAAQSEDQFKTAVLNVTSSVKQNGTSLSMNTSKGLANRDALLAAMQAALSYRDAQEKSGVSVRKANMTLAENVTQLEDAAIHAGLSKNAVEKLVKQMGLVPKNIRTEFTFVSAAAKANIAFIRQQLAELPSYKTVTVNVRTAGNLQGTINSQVPRHATGGTVGGTGSGDTQLILATPGEEIINKRQSEKHRSLLKAINAGLDGFATGGTVGKISLGSASHWTAGNVGQILRSGGFGSELISGLSQTMHAILAAVSSAAGMAKTAAAQVQAQVAAGLRPAPSTVAGWSSVLGQDTTSAGKAQTLASTAQANYQQLAKLAAAQDKAAKEAQNQADAAKKAATALSGSTAAEKAAKKAAEGHATSLADAAKKAKTLATAADNMASRGKSAWQKYQQAADTATQKMISDAQSLVSTFAGQVTQMQQNIQTFESGIQSGLTGGSDLATIWGNLTSNADSAKQALDAAQQALAQATPDTAALAAAQQAQSQAAQEQAAAHAQLTQALAGGNAAAILAAQQEQTDAASKLAAAQAAVQAATPTANQLATQAQAQQQLTDATNAYNQAVQAASGAGVASVLAQFQASEQQFAADLTKLKGSGAGQDLISQLAAMGSTAGDALAKGLINDPAALASITKSMKSIQSIADNEGKTLADGFFGSGVSSMQQLLAGIEKQFPETVAALAPLAAQLAAMFTITMPGGASVGAGAGSAAAGSASAGSASKGSTSNGSTGKGTSGSKITTASQTADYYLVHALENGKWYDVNPSKKSVHELTAAQLKADLAAGATVKTRTSGIPHFAAGVTDFGGGLAMVHRDELLVNLPRGTDVIPANRAKGSAPFGDTSGIERRLDRLNAQVSTLAQDIGQVQARVGVGLYERAGQAHALQVSRLARKGG